jgi:sugar fermentation stimulation protein A
MGVFQERLHRFGARVLVRGRDEYCHVTNSGRLRELLYPGAKVALVDHASKKLASGKPRKTRYSIRLAYYRKKWVCIEANVAPKLLTEAWSQGRIPELRAYRLLKAEVPLNRHTRFDFQASGSIPPGKKAWIEVKCVTLVDQKGLGRFPDAPSDRASKHLRELMLLSREPKTECFVFFILQNETGRAVGPKDNTDPLFGKTLREAARSKVRLLAWRARVDLKGARLDKSLRLDLKFPASTGARASKEAPRRIGTKAKDLRGSASTKPVHN